MPGRTTAWAACARKRVTWKAPSRLIRALSPPGRTKPLSSATGPARSSPSTGWTRPAPIVRPPPALRLTTRTRAGVGAICTWRLASGPKPKHATAPRLRQTTRPAGAWGWPRRCGAWAGWMTPGRNSTRRSPKPTARCKTRLYATTAACANAIPICPAWPRRWSGSQKQPDRPDLSGPAGLLQQLQEAHVNPHNLKGKGIWIWKTTNCESGDLDAIVARAKSAGFTHVVLKIADGDDAYQIWDRRDTALELIPKLRQAGLAVWGWNYIYGDPPARDAGKQKYWELEAMGNVKRIKQLIPAGLQGFVIDAEREYETILDRHNKAAAYMKIMRDNLPDLPLPGCPAACSPPPPPA